MSDDQLPTGNGDGCTDASPSDVTPERRSGRIDGSSPAADGLGVSEFLSVLAVNRRRYVLYHLREEGTASLEDVVERVAAWETGAPVDELDERTERNVRIDLSHVQLPKLEETGLIEYDRPGGTVTYRSPPELVEDLLDYYATIEVEGLDGE